MAKARKTSKSGAQQTTVSLRHGRLARIWALKSQHPALNKLDTLSAVIAWVLDWAISRLWAEVPQLSVQKLISDALSEDWRPWGQSSDPLSDMAEACLLEQDLLEEILKGRIPTDDELATLAGPLGWDVDDLTALVQGQYGIERERGDSCSEEAHHTDGGSENDSEQREDCERNCCAE